MLTYALNANNYPVYKIGKIVQKSENVIWPG